MGLIADKKSRRATPRKPLPLDPIASATLAHLRYVDDSGPGIRRLKRGPVFRYQDERGRPLHDAATLSRIRSLVIPPAWTDVWICPSEDGHLQATGRDARGRKQYRYHPRFRAVRDQTKYERVLSFAKVLPKIRAAVNHALSRPGLEREKVLATVVRLLEITLIRVGNEEYARQNGSFGLTTMRTRHVDVHGSTVRFHFRGKSGKTHDVDVHDRRLARIIARCNDLPGEVLFQYVDEGGQHRAIEAADVNQFLHKVAGEDFTAKDFRTWAGTVLAARALCELEGFSGVTEAKRNIVAAIKSVSARLGNTPTVCRKCYVHPEILNAYLEGQLAALLRDASDVELDVEVEALSADEVAVLAMLHRRLKSGD